MNPEELNVLIEEGREIEFLFEGRKYSITYGMVDDNEVISFCEFYQETTEVTTVGELLAIRRYGKSVEEMLSRLSDNDIWIF